MTDTRYLYSVNPHKPIILPNTMPIRNPKSLYLTLDEVKTCLKRGAVYRRFADIGINERVTVLNAERLHNEKFMTEEEYAQFLEDNVAYKRGTISEKVEKKAEEAPVESETVEEADNVEDDKAEEAPVKSETVETPDETVEEADTTTEDDEVEEAPVESETVETPETVEEADTTTEEDEEVDAEDTEDTHAESEEAQTEEKINNHNRNNKRRRR